MDLGSRRPPGPRGPALARHSPGPQIRLHSPLSLSAFCGFRYALLFWEAPGSAQAVTRERLTSCDAREAAQAGRGAGGKRKQPSSRALPPKRPILSKLCRFIAITDNIIYM